MKLKIKILENESQVYFYNKKFEVSPEYLNEPIQFKIKGQVCNKYYGNSSRDVFDIDVLFDSFEFEDNYSITTRYLLKIEREILIV